MSKSACWHFSKPAVFEYFFFENSRNQHLSQSIAAIFVQDTWCNERYKWQFSRAHTRSYMKFPA